MPGRTIMAALGLLLGWGPGLHAHAQTAPRVQVEVIKRDAQAADPSAKAYAGRKRVSALFSGHLWLMRALGGPQARSWLSIGGGVEAVLNNVDYRVEIRRPSELRSTTSNLVYPRSLRPIALAAIVVKL